MREPDRYVVVSDFRATGPTRGSLTPAMGDDGQVIQARPPGPCDKAERKEKIRDYDRDKLLFLEMNDHL